MHIWGSKSHAVYSIPLCFISDWVLIWGRCQKLESGLIIMGIWRVRRLLRFDLGVVPVIIYHFNAVPVVKLENFRVLFLRQRNIENMRFNYDFILNVMEVAFSKFKILQKCIFIIFTKKNHLDMIRNKFLVAVWKVDRINETPCTCMTMRLHSNDIFATYGSLCLFVHMYLRL